MKMDTQRIGNYIRIEQIGKGTFGQVYKATKDGSETPVAVKVIDLTQCSKKDQEHMLQEAQLHQRFQHPNIVKFKESFTEGKILCIVMEYCGMGSLRNLVQKRKGLKEEECIVVLLQISEGLKYLHERDICHRDVKTTNILLQDVDGDKFIVKIGDFGVAKMMDEMKLCVQTKFVGSPYFMSPEMTSGKPYDKRTDIWSLGCVVYEMATTNVPYDAKAEKELTKKIVEDEVSMSHVRYCERMKKLIRCMMNKDPAGRLDIYGVIAAVNQDEHFLERLITDLHVTDVNIPKHQQLSAKSRCSQTGVPTDLHEAGVDTSTHRRFSARSQFSQTWSPPSKRDSETPSHSDTGFETGGPCTPGMVTVKATVLMSPDDKELHEKAQTLENDIRRRLPKQEADDIIKKINVAIDKTKHMDNNTVFLAQVKPLMVKATFERCEADLNALWGYRRKLLTKTFAMAWSEK